MKKNPAFQCLSLYTPYYPWHLSSQQTYLNAFAEQRCDFYMIEMSKYTIDEIDELANKPKQKDIIQLKQICKNN